MVTADVILYPTGGGTGILGMWKAFDELEALGIIDERRPKMIAVQSEATAPVVNACKTSAEDTTPVPAGKTIATGINVPGGVGHFKVLQIIKNSDGAAISVSEQMIHKYMQQIYTTKMIWICPEGAATLAALEPACEMGLIKPGYRVVAFNTCTFEKYLTDIRGIIFNTQ